MDFKKCRKCGKELVKVTQVFLNGEKEIYVEFSLLKSFDRAKLQAGKRVKRAGLVAHHC